MANNLQGELLIMDSMDIKPNYAALGRKYGMDWRTVKKYHEGYKGKPSTRKKSSRLDVYKNEIIDKLHIRRVTVRGVYEFMVDKYGISIIGSYSNFLTYVKNNNLKNKEFNKGHPRYETPIGYQGQVDWKEDISIASKYGEIFVINVLHLSLSFSRYSHLAMSILKRTDDVYRCLINSFEAFGGVPKELLFDNMSTVANTHGKKKPTSAILKLAKDFNFRVRLCGTRMPETKGSVEAKNKVVDWIRSYEGEFEDLEELTLIIKKINEKMNININDETRMSPTALFYKEKEHLQALPHRSIIDSYLCPNKYKVSNESLIRYGNSKYSVDPKFINEEVTIDIFDNNLYIYYKGKLIAFHPLNKKPINYKPEHYRTLMKGKVKETDMDMRIKENLNMMDNILESRKVVVSPIEATKSAAALIAFINQHECGRWVINNYAHLSATEQLTFIKGMNKVLPYVKNKDVFISRIKFSMKQNLCKTIDFDCFTNDMMAFSDADCILTQEGYKIIGDKYEKEIEELVADLREQWGISDDDNDIETKKELRSDLELNDSHEEFPFESDEELPFK